MSTVAPLSYQTTQTAGPAFSSSRVLRFADFSCDEQEAFIRFFAEQRVSFFRDVDGAYVANVRLYDPAIIDIAASQRAKQKEDGKLSARDTGIDASLSNSSTPQIDYSVYSRFLGFVSSRDGAKPKARPVAWLMRQVEEMYDQRYAKDTAEIRGQMEGEAETATSTPFPNFVFEFFSKRYGLRSLVDQNCWDMLYNVHLLRKDYLEVEVFARFLEEYYDADDLLFFLYVRSVIQKELNVSFRTRWSELGKAGAAPAADAAALAGVPTPLHLTVRDCQVVARVVFGSESDPLYRTFISIVERHLTGQKKGKSDGRKIECTQFLHLALVEYHETRPADERELAALNGSRTQTTSVEEYTLDEHTVHQPPSPAQSTSNTEKLTRLYDLIGEAVSQASQEYLDRLLEGAGGLPREVQQQIRNEVRNQLEGKVDSVLSALLSAQKTGSRIGTPASDAVLDSLSALIAAASHGAEEDSAAVTRVAHDIVRLPDVQDTVTPLVSLLITYATRRLEEAPRR